MGEAPVRRLKSLIKWDPLGWRGAVECVEGTGAELDAERSGNILELNGKAGGVDSMDLCGSGFDGEVDVGMGERFLEEGRVAAEVPADEPEVFEEGSEILRWGEAEVAEGASRRGGTEDAAGRADRGIVVLSCFSNPVG